MKSAPEEAQEEECAKSGTQWGPFIMNFLPLIVRFNIVQVKKVSLILIIEFYVYNYNVCNVNISIESDIAWHNWINV
jgi:hypothetical protein